MFTFKFLLSASPLAYTPPGLCLSDAGAAGGGAGTGGGAGGTGNGDGAAAFLAQLPEDIRGEAYFRDIKDVSGLATRAFHQAKLIGAPPDQVIRLPGPDDTAAWDGVYARLGRPEAADKYQLADPKPEELPSGFTVSPEAKTAFATKAHELGLSNRQADALYGWMNGTRVAGFKSIVEGEQAAKDAAIAGLKTEFGQAWERAQENTNLAVDTLETTLKLPAGALKAALDEMPAASRPALFKAFAHIGGTYREDGTLPGQGGGSGGSALAPAEALQQINALRADQQFSAAYIDARAPGHADAVAKMQKLYEQAFPTPQAA